jgi:GNAT superfamily N-acetyltransferase
MWTSSWPRSSEASKRSPETLGPIRFRRAVARDAALLAGLSYRSKAHWGYDVDFMDRVRADLTPSPEYLESCPVYVAETVDGVVGFYGFRELDGLTFLYDMFVEPEYIGRGVGASLWRHAVETARGAGYPEFFIESDPFALPFYLRMGALPKGERVSPTSGRALPLLVYRMRR